SYHQGDLHVAVGIGGKSKVAPLLDSAQSSLALNSSSPVLDANKVANQHLVSANRPQEQRDGFRETSAESTNRKIQETDVEGGLKHSNYLNASSTFATFVEGKSNQLGLAAARQVAENPGGAYNP